MTTAAARIAISMTPDQKAWLSGSFTGADDGWRTTEDG
jgi:hypothetical protein